MTTALNQTRLMQDVDDYPCFGVRIAAHRLIPPERRKETKRRLLSIWTSNVSHPKECWEFVWRYLCSEETDLADIFWVVDLPQASRRLGPGPVVFQVMPLPAFSTLWPLLLEPGRFRRIQIPACLAVVQKLGRELQLSGKVITEAVITALKTAEEDLPDADFFYLQPVWQETWRGRLEPMAPAKISREEQRQKRLYRRHYQRWQWLNWLSPWLTYSLSCYLYDPIIVACKKAANDQGKPLDLLLIAHWD